MLEQPGPMYGWRSGRGESPADPKRHCEFIQSYLAGMEDSSSETKERRESCRGCKEERSPGIAEGLWGPARSGLISIQYL